MRSYVALPLTLVLLGAPRAVGAATAPPPIVATASASLPGEGPERLVDDNAGRPWIAPFDPASPPSVTLDLGAVRWIGQLRFIPGHARSNATFAQYARPARLRVAWDTGERVFDLHDRRGRQTLELGRLVVTERLTLTVESVYGDAREGVAIADVALVERHDPSSSKIEIYQRMQRFLLALADDAAYEHAQRYLVRFGDKAAVPLVRLVAKATPTVRLRALETLLDLGGDEAQATVADLLASHRTDLQLALSVLSLRPAPGHEEALLALVGHADPSVSLASQRALARAGTSRARQSLVAALRGPAGAARDAAAEALGSANAETALDIARTLMADKPGTSRAAVLAALGPVARREPSVLAFLVGVARQSASPDDRVAALGVLAKVPAPETRALLIELMRRSEPRVARAAIRAFYAQDPDAEAFVSAQMDNLRPAVVEEAVVLSRDRDSDAATMMLVRALSSGVWEPWYGHAAELLARRGEAGVGAVVTWLVDHPRDERVVRHFLVDHPRLAAPAAAAALPLIRKSRAHTDAKLLLFEILRDSGNPVGVEIARSIYLDPTAEATVRRAAFDALANVGEGPDVEELVLTALDDEDPAIRRIAYLAAGRHHIDAALPRVQREIARTRPDQWSPGVVTAYGDLGGESAIGVLKRHYPVAPQSTRLAILAAAWRSGSVEGIALLIDATSSPDRETRRRAIALLEQPR